MTAKIAEVGPRLGVRATCAALGMAPASYYRQRRAKPLMRARSSPRALRPEERQQVLDVPRFVDLAPAEVYAP